jgi:YD repeat-containing protein
VSFSAAQAVVFDIASIPGGWTVGNSLMKGNNHKDWSKATVKHLDFNGDHREDITITLSVGNGPYYMFALATNGNVYTVAAQLATSYGAFPIKWNDDGCTDWYDTNFVKLATCDGTLGSVTVGINGHPIDWNGDGLTDFFQAGSYPNYQTYVALSTGDESPGAAFLVPGITLAETPNYFLFDQNGDGLDDLMVYGCGDVSYPLCFGLHQGAGSAPDLVASITDGYSIAYNLSYVSITQSNYTKGTGATYPEKDIQGPKIVVSQITSSDGIGGTYTQSFNYSGAREDNQGRGFLGFQSRTVTDSRTDAPVVKAYYKTAFPYTGVVYQEEVYQHNGTTLLSRTVNTPAFITLDSTANNQRYFPYIANSTVDAYEINGALSATTTKSATYDNYGNVTTGATTVTDKDTGSPYLNQSWTTTINNSFLPSSSVWCIGLPWQSVISNSASNGESSVSRTVNYSIDYTYCRVTQQVAAPSTAYRVTTDLGYDSFGNVNSQTITGYGMSARTTTAGWGATGQFPVSVTNALNQTTQAGYDYNKGVQSSQTDANGITTSWQYDSFARKALESRADGTSTLWSYALCSGCDPLPRMVVTEQRRDTSSAVINTSTSYFDQLDRPIYQLSQLLDGSTAWTTLRTYDARGRVSKEYFPRGASAASAGSTDFTYDALNRVIQAQRPISASNSAVQTTTYQYQGRTTVVTDAEGKTTTKITDVNGWLRRSQDMNGYYQNFGYDAFGSLKSVTDSQSNTLFQSTYAYGLQPFQTSTFDMDLGSWGYTPNALGEVMAYTDNKGISFTASYDALSRPLTRTEPDNTTAWTWGNNAGLHNIGQLQSVTSITGTTENYSYDAIGRLSQRDITADGTTYSYSSSYNSLGLPDTLTYPTSTSGYRLKLQYLYQNGILQKVKDFNASTIFWQANAMNSRGQITQAQLGNGIVANRNYRLAEQHSMWHWQRCLLAEPILSVRQGGQPDPAAEQQSRPH